MFSFQEKAQIIEFPKHVMFFKGFLLQTESRVLAVISAVAAGGQCDSLSPLPKPRISSHPPAG